MGYVPSVLLAVESLLSFYKYFVPGSFFGPRVLDLILGAVFLIFAFLIFKNPKQRVLQWLVVIVSLVLGPGGFIGFGGLFALALAISFILISKKNDKH